MDAAIVDTLALFFFFFVIVGVRERQPARILLEPQKIEITDRLIFDPVHHVVKPRVGLKSMSG